MNFKDHKSHLFTLPSASLGKLTSISTPSRKRKVSNTKINRMAKMKEGINIWIKTKIETVQIKLKETQSKKQPSNQTKILEKTK